MGSLGKVAAVQRSEEMAAVSCAAANLLLPVLCRKELL